MIRKETHRYHPEVAYHDPRALLRVSTANLAQ